MKALQCLKIACLVCAAMLQVATTEAQQPVTVVAEGDAHSLFLKGDGSLWAMGYNNWGQLGDGTYDNTNHPEQIVVSNATAIAAGYGHSLFLRSDGSLWAMGYNYFGQLGDGTIGLGPYYFSGTNVPEQIVASNVVAIAAGDFHSLFLKSNGSLWAMGENEIGELGDGTFANAYIPEQIVASNVTAVAAGGSDSLFLKSDGTLWVMGWNGYGQLGDGTHYNSNIPRQIVASNVTAIAAGYGHSLFLKSDGSLWAMGLNTYGQLGDGTTDNCNCFTNDLPEQIVASNVTAIAAGYGHSLFLKSDGSLWAMGDNEDGQLGDGTYNTTNQPEQIVAGNVTAIAAGGNHSLFLTSNGSLWAMGDNEDGQLGDGTFNSPKLPEQIVNNDFGYIINGDGTITITGYTGSGGAVTIPSTINGLPVTSIGANAFNDGISLTSLTVPNSITNIGDLAFLYCVNLTEVYFMGNAPSLGSYIFFGDDNAIVYYLPGTTGWDTTFGSRPTVLFEFNFAANNGAITITGYTGAGGDVTVPTSINGLPVTQIGDNAFQNCTNLTSISIPNSVTSIGNYAFSNCLGLTYVTIGSRVTNIGEGTFTGCLLLIGIYFEGNAPKFVSDLFASDDNATVYYLPGTTGWDTTFGGRPTVLIQFNYTANNGAITITGYTGAGADVTVPTSIKGLPVTQIGDNAFQNCTNLTSITIPDSVTSIGDNAFSFCASLTNVTIGASVNSIGFWAFYSCNSLTNVTIPDSVTSIGDYAFENCGSLTSVTIGNSVTSIGDWAFSVGNSLTSVYFMGNAPSFGSWVFLWDLEATFYYLPGTSGWGSQAVLWLPAMQTSDGSFGVRTNLFGFNINWASGQTVVVEACTNLTYPVWSPVATNTLIDGTAYFSDSQWTNYPGRFYRLRSP